jgi:UDP-glucose 4-epimerase
MIQSIVTGGSGFIGSNVVDVLREAGHHVIVVDLVPPTPRPGVEFRRADITDLTATRRALEGADYVHHMAAVSDVNHAFARPVHCVDTNVMGTANVLEAARGHRVKRVLFSSTVWVYNGTADSVVDESTPLSFSGAGHVYTSSKIAGELLAHDYAVQFGLDVTVLRYGIVYGPGMRKELLVPTLLRRAFEGQPLQLTGGGLQARSFVYVKDLAKAHLLALDSRCANQTFNLEGPRPVTVMEVAERVRDLVGDHVRFETTPGRPGDYSGKIVSRDKTREFLGWQPTTTFEIGLPPTFDWYRAMHAAEVAGKPASDSKYVH